MGWTVHYRMMFDGSMSADDAQLLSQVAKNVNARLHHGSEPFRLERLSDLSEVESAFGTVDPAKTYLWGGSQVAFSDEPEDDFATVVTGLKAIAERFPSWNVHVADDYGLVDGDVRLLGDPRRLPRR